MTGETPIKALILAELPELTLDSPKYSETQNQLAKAEGAIKTEKGWWELPSGKLLVPDQPHRKDTRKAGHNRDARDRKEHSAIGDFQGRDSRKYTRGQHLRHNVSLIAPEPLRNDTAG